MKKTAFTLLAALGFAAAPVHASAAQKIGVVIYLKDGPNSAATTPQAAWALPANKVLFHGVVPCLEGAPQAITDIGNQNKEGETAALYQVPQGGIPMVSNTTLYCQKGQVLGSSSIAVTKIKPVPSEEIFRLNMSGRPMERAEDFGTVKAVPGLYTYDIKNPPSYLTNLHQFGVAILSEGDAK